MNPTIDDAHLLTAWQNQRDAEAFRILCDRHLGLVEAACRRQGSPDVAEAVQAVCLVLARRAGSVSGASLGGWLTTTAQRVVGHQHRAAASRWHHEQEAAVEHSRQRAPGATDPSWEEARQQLDAALASLSPARREAVLRFYLEGKPQAQVAAELGCSVDAVKTRVHESLEHLRAFFARRGVTLGAAVLASGLAAEASASEPGLSAICLQTVLQPAGVPAAQALAHKVLTVMFIKTFALVATGILLTGQILMSLLMTSHVHAAEITRIQLSDVHPLWGGRMILITNDGDLHVVVKGNPYTRKDGRIDFGQYIKSLHVEVMEKYVEHKRNGLPDEAKPEIRIHYDNGVVKSYAKWANDQDPIFDAVYDRLSQLEQNKSLHEVAPAMEQADLAVGNNQFACDLLARIGAKEPGNLFFSPFSIRSALAMTYAGARGATAAQMKQALRINWEDDRFHAAMDGAIANLNAGGPGRPELAVANSLWGERTCPFLQSFVGFNQSFYKAGLELVDFKTASEAARQRINGWVADKTRQKVLDLVPPAGVAPSTRLVLVNAVYFKGLWEQRFDPARTTQAAWADGQRQVPLMQQRATFRYAQQSLVEKAGPGAGQVQLLELPYAGGTASMIALLPSHGTALADVERTLTAEKLATALAALLPQEVEVGLPRFSMAWGTKDLGPKGLAILPDLGMKEAFVYPKADFSGMDGTHNLYVDAVFHKAFVEVQEEGTVAAAATAVVVADGGAHRKPTVFRADRPFLFLIRERASGAILFLGRITAP